MDDLNTNPAPIDEEETEGGEEVKKALSAEGVEIDSELEGEVEPEEEEESNEESTDENM